MNGLKPVCLAALVIGALGAGCGSGVKVPRSKFRPLLPGVQLTVGSAPIRMTGRDGRPRNIPSLFEWEDVTTDRLLLRTDSSGGVLLALVHGQDTITRSYSCTRSKRGYYELYLEKDVVEIPPFIPMIYSRCHLSRLRLAMTAAGEMVIDHKWANDGNILFLAGGGRGRTQYFFKPPE